jgi:hypothetical protein
LKGRKNVRQRANAGPAGKVFACFFQKRSACFALFFFEKRTKKLLRVWHSPGISSVAQWADA